MAPEPGRDELTTPARPRRAGIPMAAWVGGGALVLATVVGATSIVAAHGPHFGGLAVSSPSSAPDVAAPAAPSSPTTEPTAPLPTPTPVATFTAESPADPDTVVASETRGETVVDRSVTSDTTALALLATLPIKGRAPMTGYDRTGMFGSAWPDVDGNGCDTRNDMLARDLSAITKSGSCKVMSGTLVSPYTKAEIHFVRGVDTSAEVQIDHVVALANAWQTGAQQLTHVQRISFANDPLNLLAVDGRSNAQKGAGDAATWLPASKSFRCTYVARQISVKASYGLWVTRAEHDAMARILGTCPNQAAVSSPFAVAPAPKPAPKPSTTKKDSPAPAKPAPEPKPEPKPKPKTEPEPDPKPAPKVVHPGSFCSTEGDRGVTKKGTPMVCSYKTGDPRLRWRSAG